MSVLYGANAIQILTYYAVKNTAVLWEQSTKWARIAKWWNHVLITATKLNIIIKVNFLNRCKTILLPKEKRMRMWWIVFQSWERVLSRGKSCTKDWNLNPDRRYSILPTSIFAKTFYVSNLVTMKVLPFTTKLRYTCNINRASHPRNF